MPEGASLSDSVSSSVYPVTVVQDRYQGIYSRGRWLAIANAKEHLGSTLRGGWVLENGPSGGDMDAAGFWSDAPDWIASGDTPDDAFNKLCLASGPRIS